MLRVHPAVGAALFLLGIGLFVVGIVDTTADAPSGSVSVKAADTPWLIFAGVACSIFGGIVSAVTAGRRRRSFAAGAEQLSAFVPAGAPGPAADALDSLERLVALRDAGALTAAEFEAQKARVLRGP